MVPAAAACWIGGAAVMVLGVRRGLAEMTILGAALTVQSGFGLVHGLTAPGVLYGASTAFAGSALLGVPVGLTAGIPLLSPSSSLSRRLAVRAHLYAACSVTAGTGLAGAVLVWPNGLPAPDLGAAPTLLLAGAGVLGGTVLSWRQLTLFQVSGRPVCLAASLSLLALGTTGLIWIGGSHSRSPGGWPTCWTSAGYSAPRQP